MDYLPRAIKADPPLCVSRLCEEIALLRTLWFTEVGQSTYGVQVIQVGLSPQIPVMPLVVEIARKNILEGRANDYAEER